MKEKKAHGAEEATQPTRISKPNPMSSHSACTSREFCMTCAATRDKGRMGCWCPPGRVGEMSGCWGCYKEVGGSGWRGDILRPLYACDGGGWGLTLPPLDLFVGSILKSPGL